MPESKGQLAVVMISDMVENPAMMVRDKKKTKEIFHQGKEIQKPLIQKNDGYCLKEDGGVIMARFNTVQDAVNCALEIQNASREDMEVKLRIGIHLGNLIQENESFSGNGVKVALRLKSVADPGGIYVSDSVEMAIRDQSGILAKFLGEIRLENDIYGIRAYALQGNGLPIPKVRNSKVFFGRFWAELYRRNILLAGTVYIMASVILIQMIQLGITFGIFSKGFFNSVLIILLVGFPVALFFAWKYEQSPSGFVRTDSGESWRNPFRESQRKPLTSRIMFILLAVMILILYVLQEYILSSNG